MMLIRKGDYFTDNIFKNDEILYKLYLVVFYVLFEFIMGLDCTKYNNKNLRNQTWLLFNL